MQRRDKNPGISSRSPRAAIAAAAEVRSNERLPQFTVSLLFALTSSPSNDLIIQTLRFLCLRMSFVLADGSVVPGVW
jgi:hypothetical protein